MTVRERVIEAFPPTRPSEHTIFDMASVLWPKAQAEKLRHVSGWTELLEMPVDTMGPSGIGAVLIFMDPDLAVAYLPAWLVMAYEHPFPFAGVLPSLVRVLDNEGEMDSDDEQRFEAIRSALSSAQRNVIANAFDEMADVHFNSKPELKAHLQRIAAYWKGQAT